MRGMRQILLSYCAGMVLRYGVTLMMILSMNFVIPRIMPGDPMINLLGEDAVRVDKEVLDSLRVRYRLDGPLHEQYGVYLLGLARFDFGFSIHKNLRVADLLANRIFRTLMLVLPSVVMGGGAALALGLICGLRSGSGADRWITALATCLYTVPAFLLAMVMVSVFSFHLGWFPLGSFSSGGKQGMSSWLDIGWHLSLPVFILSILEAAFGLIIMRSAVIQVREEYFILVAHAKGLSLRALALKHVLRNVLPQFVSFMALNLGYMVGGALVIEIVFSLNGMGTLIYDAVRSRDYPVMQGAFVVLTLVMLAANLLADLVYGMADPRVADGRRGGVTP